MTATCSLTVHNVYTSARR